MKTSGISRKGRGVLLQIIAVFGILSAASCSIPNFATDECVEAKPAIREFYSFHFGNDMTFNAENLARRERYLTSRFAGELRGRTGPGDPFTVNTDDLPRAFRVGECRTASPDRVAYDVLLFWKDDASSRQAGIVVELQKTDGQWLIDRVAN